MKRNRFNEFKKIVVAAYAAYIVATIFISLRLSFGLGVDSQHLDAFISQNLPIVVGLASFCMAYHSSGEKNRRLNRLFVSSIFSSFYMLIATVMLVPFYLMASFGDTGFTGFWLAQELLLSLVSFSVLAWFIVRYARVFAEKVNK